MNYLVATLLLGIACYAHYQPDSTQSGNSPAQLIQNQEYQQQLDSLLHKKGQPRDSTLIDPWVFDSAFRTDSKAPELCVE